MLRFHRTKALQPLEPATLKSIMWQLLNGLSYLEQNWIIHRDLKPSNILVMGDGEQQVLNPYTLEHATYTPSYIISCDLYNH